MMRSLRGRHLLNGIVIIIMGILVLGALLSLSIYQSRTEAVGDELERTALDLLGYIEYENGTFVIADPNSSDAESFLNERKLITSGKERFAYLWDVSQQKVIWDSLDNNNVDQQEVKNNFALFDFETLHLEAEKQRREVYPVQAKRVYSLPVTEGEEPTQYMVAMQTFSMKVDGGRKAFLFIVATSIADIEAEIYDLISTLLLLLVITAALLLVAQLIFTGWVMAPIRRFEQEMLEIENGNKTTFEHDYPNELQSIQNSVNALMKRG
ncbi:MAG: hypothetical protein ACPGSM_15275 [Thiolinea sp.]